MDHKPEYDTWEIQYYIEEEDRWQIWRRRNYVIRSVNAVDFSPREDITDPKAELAEHKARYNARMPNAESFNKLKWRIVSYKYKPCNCPLDTVMHFEDVQ